MIAGVLMTIVLTVMPVTTPMLEPPEPLTMQSLAIYRDTLQLMYRPEPLRLPVKASNRSFSVEQWRPLVEKYFAATDVDTAMRILKCESHGNPYAKNRYSSASGLFQHLARYWPERSAKAGWAGASIWNPEANIAVAAWLKATAGWGSWTCY